MALALRQYNNNTHTMKIAYFLHTTSRTDGSTKAFLHLINQLKRTDTEVLVILPNRQGLYQYLQDCKIPTIALRYSFRSSTYPSADTIKDKILFIFRLFGRLIVNSLATIQSINIIRLFQPDIIHTNTGVLSIGYHVARFCRIPYVWHLREYSAWGFHTYPYPSFRTQQRRLKQSHTICITKALQHHYQLTHTPQSHVIYDGVLPLSATTYNPNKAKYLLYAGTFSDVKGILPLINAYTEYVVKCPSALPLWIAGTGSESYIQKIKDLIDHHQLNNHIHLLGMRDDIDLLYQKATALVVPSLSEGFGFITAEAMFNGCLVIGHDVAGTKEQFDNGKSLTGEEIALRYTSQQQLVEHLLHLTHIDITQYEPMILRGQMAAAQLYATEVHAQKIFTLYQTIANQ